eukprot:GHVP01040114.1.p1 GENE.GHVP01040114.1~~GHVP01040114.1.p1  ORF type:complete len:175 (+),score=23.11 GHVP01040114.1:158-682(+)
MHLNDILGRLSKANLTVQLEKCSFGHDSLQYLGHQISADGVSPLEGKVKEILKLKTPRDQKELRSILGSFGFYRAHMPNFSEAAEPLTKLLRKKTEWQWGEDEENCLAALKKKLTESSMLFRLDAKKEANSDNGCVRKRTWCGFITRRRVRRRTTGVYILFIVRSTAEVVNLAT